MSDFPSWRTVEAAVRRGDVIRTFPGRGIRPTLEWDSGSRPLSYLTVAGLIDGAIIRPTAVTSAGTIWSAAS